MDSPLIALGGFWYIPTHRRINPVEHLRVRLYASAPHVFHKTYEPPETSSETCQISKMELS